MTSIVTSLLHFGLIVVGLDHGYIWQLGVNELQDSETDLHRRQLRDEEEVGLEQVVA